MLLFSGIEAFCFWSFVKEENDENQELQVSRVITAVTPAVQSVDTECSFQVAIICRQIKYPVQQQLAYNNLYEFPLSSQSHLAQPAPRAIKDHKTHHYSKRTMCF